MNYYQHPMNMRPKPPSTPAWVIVLICVVVAGGVGTCGLVVSKNPAGSSDYQQRPHKQSSVFASPTVSCNRLGDSVSCSVQMSGGHGIACWNMSLVCNDADRQSQYCSADLGAGEVSSYSMRGYQFSPELKNTSECTSFRVTDVVTK